MTEPASGDPISEREVERPHIPYGLILIALFAAANVASVVLTLIVA